ncbi:hypothetical protein PaG_04173 [Moesziomyces aphidis]|uniref:Mmc1 C-terminal domain-containing protein n=1 Tax=Moesziomyces aphidis TaxID=84754 RepID=W3VJH8_MOEAP|nr:hypothetical protein PaG_04173 [Moesziomyces aphidis]
MSLATPSRSVQRGVRLRLNSAVTASLPTRCLASSPAVIGPRRLPLSSRDSRPLGASLIHTTSTSAQAVEAVSRAKDTTTASSSSSAALVASEPLSDTLIRARQLTNASDPVLAAQWINRLEQLSSKARHVDGAAGHATCPTRVALVGSSLSQTRQLVAAMIDEPLREVGSHQVHEAELISTALASLPPSTAFTIRYAPGPAQLSADTATLDRHWLQRANLHLTVLVDPEPSEATYDLVYDSEAAFFVTDDYALSRSAHTPRSSDVNATPMHDLLCRFAAKPHIHLVVNAILGLDHARVVDGLEAATGPSVSALLLPNLISVRASDALAANAALRQALTKPDQPTDSVGVRAGASTLLWDDFSRHFQRSNVGSLIDVVQLLESRHGSEALFAQSAAFLLQHCLDEAMATVRRNQACLYQLHAVTAEASAREQATLKQSLERIWPPATAYTGQLASEDVHVWRPAAPGSNSAVDVAMRQTDESIEATFDSKLQWWKLVWKVDDLRKELEAACANFAASLESDLAYESGRLATLQKEHVHAADELLHQFRRIASELGPGIPAVSRDVALLSNEAEAGRSSLRTIEPSTLMEPIARRRAQLLQVGGPIDELATKSRRLAVTSSAAVAVTAAGVGSASVLGASLDATAASLALDPSTGLGLGLLTLTLVGWRMQGQYNKYRRHFRRDWQRFSEGLDQDLKRNFEAVLRNNILGPSTLASQRIATLTRDWAATVSHNESRVRSVAASTPTSLPADTPQQPNSTL